MENGKYQFTRTLRCKNLNVPGTLGKLTSTIGKVGVDIGNLTTVHLGHNYTVRDIEVMLRSQEDLATIIDEVSKIKEVTVLEVRDEVLDLHKDGKIKTVSVHPINTIDILRKVYTPGVAEVCKLIQQRPGLKYTYTNIQSTIAIVTDGTAILGLGNIGPEAGMPVMEGKAALLQELVGVSGIPILLNTTDVDQIVETIKYIAPTFGAIHLEDIASPRCFPILDRLINELDVPVMHDDQQGTAVVVLAALINACNIVKVSLEEAKIGVIGLGAAGLTIASFLLEYTGKPAMGTARTEASIKRHVGRGGIPSNLNEIMEKADIVVATSGVQGLIEPSMVRKGQIILALSNPIPEITPELAKKAGAALAVDGRTVNNLLGYPGIWRGTLDAMANKLNYEMYKAGALAIVDTTDEGELVPNPLDAKVHRAVTHAVAKAAVDSGVAQRPLDNDYFENLNIKQPPWM
ncbi:MAG TPA: malic enzyme-like NAD(P)-binding protein [Dehalococcoidia bacterium]|jgi:malate dehydrogenase (oxaloacetate-decarboxylating)